MYPIVIPVAGVGTRSLPASKVIPKEMMPVFDRPIIQHIIEEAVSGGCQDLILVTSSGKSIIEDHFKPAPALENFLKERGKTELLKEVQRGSNLVQAKSVIQKEALGLGHAIGVAESEIKSSHFFVMLGDEMTDSEPTAVEQLLEAGRRHEIEKNGAGVILLIEVSDEDVSKYGICEMDLKTQKISSAIEKPKSSETKSRLAITGRYLLPKEIFKKIANLSKRGGEIQLTEALDALAREGKLFGHIYKGTRLDAGDRLGFLKANLHFYLKSSLKADVQKLLKEYE